MRKVGVEEELLLVDPETGEQRNLAPRVLDEYRHHPPAGPHPDLEPELLEHMVESQTSPCTDLAEIGRQLRQSRRMVIAAAGVAGAAVAATGIAPLASAPPRVTRQVRYERIFTEYGALSRQSGTLGMHVHVDVADDEEGVRVLDGLRPWLPVLIAVAANSPYADGQDTGHASWRHQLWTHWPTTGPGEPFGSAAGYHGVAAGVLASGAALDRGMLYFDARLAARYPTVEIRVADACTDVEDAVLVAALARALVETTAGAPVPAEPARSDLLRAAQWRAARYGVSGRLVHPVDGTLAPAGDVLRDLVSAVRPALEDAGDLDLVEEGRRRLLAVGDGASRQHLAFERTGTLQGVVADLVARTERSAG